MQNILQCYPDVILVNVVAHFDIAPAHKSDPACNFLGGNCIMQEIAAWDEEATKQQYQQNYDSYSLAA